jgi:uncharacterized coiled-coil protein SlyX
MAKNLTVVALEHRLSELEHQIAKLLDAIDGTTRLAVGQHQTVLRSLEKLERVIPWRCEECGSHNAMPEAIALYVNWRCPGCGMFPMDDIVRLYQERHQRSTPKDILDMTLNEKAEAPRERLR